MAIALAVIITLTLLLALRGLAVMLLWNWIMPGLTGLPEVSFFEAVGMFLLAMFLMGDMYNNNNALTAKKAEKK